VSAAGTNGSAVKDVTVNWGDGSLTQDLGAISGSASVSHVYQNAGTFFVQASLTDISGNVVLVSTSVTVVPVANPTIIITPSVPATSGGLFTTVNFQLQVTPPAGVGILDAIISFGDGQSNDLGGLSGSTSVSHPYDATHRGQITVTLTVKDTLNRTTSGTASINVP
jgi:hypothetical protein